VREAGVPCEFVTVHGAGHGCAGPAQIKQMVDFFVKHLGKPRKATKPDDAPVTDPKEPAPAPVTPK